jgi:hypothetical protein
MNHYALRETQTPSLGHFYDGGQGESLVPPYTRGRACIYVILALSHALLLVMGAGQRRRQEFIPQRRSVAVPVLEARHGVAHHLQAGAYTRPLFGSTSAHSVG